MLSIQTNVNSLIAQQNLNINNEFQSKTIQQLTSGYRINASGDDAAGLAVANKYRNSVSELTQGVANGNDGVAQLQIMDGGMSNISQILDRLKTLATQSASGTLSGGDATRVTLNSEFQTDLGEIDRQAQSIGLDTGGSFAKSLQVYLGQGSGSQSLQNGIVSLDLANSAVDTQALGMKGMQATGTQDIGTTSGNSVQNIVNDTTGTWANQEAVSGHASFQFSGAGFSDAGKQTISVNLAGVTDVSTLASAVNSAIQSAGQGGTSSATNFANANIVASVATLSGGGQALAFSSSTAAFQVQAGDQMANALMGNFSAAGQANGASQGVAVTGAATAVTGVATTAGTFTSGQTVLMVVNGGGLANPVTLSLDTSAAQGVQTTDAITALESQFNGNAALQAAGLSMAGSNVVGSTLSFNSATGQSFNVQVTGDTQNLLGLGSFLTNSGKTADYTSITMGSYSASTVTGSATTTAQSANLQVSINGQPGLSLAAIDLTAGAHATVATVTSGTSVTPANLNITAANANLNVTVINNGVVDNQAFALTPNTLLTSGASGSSVATSGTFATVTLSAANHNDTFSISVDGGAAQTMTVDGTYNSAASLKTLINNQIANNSANSALVGEVSATVDATSGVLSLTSANSGSSSSVSLAALASGSTTSSVNTSGTFATVTLSAANHNDKFSISLDGGPAQNMTVDGTYNSAASLQALINNQIANNSANSALVGKVSATVDPTSGVLSLTSTSTGAASSVLLNAVSSGSQASTTATNGTFGTVTLSAANHNDTFNITLDGGATQTMTVDGTYNSAAGLAALINSQIASNGANSALVGKVSATQDPTSGVVSLTSATIGANSSVVLGNIVSGASASTAATSGTFGTVTISAANHNDSFMVAIDGGPAVKLTVTDGSTYNSAAGLQGLLSSAITTAGLGSKLSAIIAPNNGEVTLVSKSTGASSSVSLTQSTYSSAAKISTTGGSGLTVASSGIVVGTGDNTFNIALDGGQSYTITMGTSAGESGASFLADLKSQISSNSNLTGVTAAFDGPGGMLQLTTTATGGAASINLSQNSTSTFLSDFGFSGLPAGPSTSFGSDATLNTGLGTMDFSTGSSGTFTNGSLAAMDFGTGGNTVLTNQGLGTMSFATNTNTALTSQGLNTMGFSTGIHRGTNDAPTTLQSIATLMQNAFGASAVVSVNNNELSIASASKGANSSVVLNAVDNSAYNTLNLTTLSGTGTNSSIGDVVANLNSQFTGSTYQAAGLTAAITDSSGNANPAGSYISISSNNGTQFRLNSIGGGTVGTSASLASTSIQKDMAGPYTVTGANNSFTLNVDGGVANAVTIGTGAYANSDLLLAAVQTAIAGSADDGKVTAGWDATSGALTFTAVSSGTQSTLTMAGAGAAAFLGITTTSGTGAGAAQNTAVADIGFGTAGTGFSTNLSSATAISTQLAGGVSNTAGTGNAAAFDFKAMVYGSDKQAITLSASDANGNLETKTITLANNAGTNRAGVSIDSAVAYINSQLQASTNQPALQQIVAVKQADATGTKEQINFISKLTGFTVGISGTANADGINNGAAAKVDSSTFGTSANISINTQGGAQAAITAIGNAVSSLGTAQAAVGKGENQLSYALNLAQSQITNFSAAESQIRDADVAQQAANLSKAQVLQQSSIAAMAQANSAPQAVLSLLKG